MNTRPNVFANLISGAGIALVLAVGTFSAVAQVSRPGPVGQIVVGVPPGSNLDATARFLAEYLSEKGGQRYIVLNRPGAGGAIAAEVVARSTADGMTLFLSPISTMVTEPQINKQNVRYDPFRDFTPVSTLATIDLALAVGPALKVTNFVDYLAAVKADPTKGQFTSPGVNGLPHFFGMQIGRQSGTPLTHIPMGGPAPAVQAVLGGHVPALIVGYSDLVGLHQAKNVTMLATSGPSRVALTPEVPTFKELGYPLEVSVWYGLFAPGGTPAATVDRISKLAADAVRSEKMSEYLTKSGHRLVGSTPEELATTHRTDFKRWGEFIRAIVTK
jgi:tripartite-type tricarboxylate transporter receptor subunit TctC